MSNDSALVTRNDSPAVEQVAARNYIERVGAFLEAVAGLIKNATLILTPFTVDHRARLPKRTLSSVLRPQRLHLLLQLARLHESDPATAVAMATALPIRTLGECLAELVRGRETSTSEERHLLIGMLDGLLSADPAKAQAMLDTLDPQILVEMFVELWQMGTAKAAAQE